MGHTLCFFVAKPVWLPLFKVIANVHTARVKDKADRAQSDSHGVTDATVEPSQPTARSQPFPNRSGQATVGEGRRASGGCSPPVRRSRRASRGQQIGSERQWEQVSTPDARSDGEYASISHTELQYVHAHARPSVSSCLLTPRVLGGIAHKSTAGEYANREGVDRYGRDGERGEQGGKLRISETSAGCTVGAPARIDA